MRERLGLALQALGSGLILAGLIYEVAVRASLGLILITLGSFVYAVGVKLSKPKA